MIIIGRQDCMLIRRTSLLVHHLCRTMTTPSTSAASVPPKRLRSPPAVSKDVLSKKKKIDGPTPSGLPIDEPTTELIDMTVATLKSQVSQESAKMNEMNGAGGDRTSPSITPAARNPAPLRAKKDKKEHKPFKRRVKPPKPGGAEETGHFDVLTFLGSARVAELRASEETNGDGKYAAEMEWGVGMEGRDIEVRILGISAHGK